MCLTQLNYIIINANILSAICPCSRNQDKNSNRHYAFSYLVRSSPSNPHLLSLAWVVPDRAINRYAKDIKTALLAADIIINEWGFKDYRLDIYGALDKSPAYTTNCQEIIATKSLRHQVTLKGEADPIQVLEKTVRSSLSLT